MKTPFKASEAVMILQVAYLTEDIDATIKWFAELLDVPVPVVNEGPSADVANTRYQGQPAEVGFKQAIMKWRGTQLEFIQPDNSPSVWRDWLNEHGPGLHHLGFAVGDFDAAKESLKDEGLEIVQEGEFPTNGRYAYADATAQVGSFIEILSVDPDEVRTYGMDH